MTDPATKLLALIAEGQQVAYEDWTDGAYANWARTALPAAYAALRVTIEALDALQEQAHHDCVFAHGDSMESGHELHCKYARRLVHITEDLARALNALEGKK